MTREERSNIVLAFARFLYVNGESTQQTLGVVERVSTSLGQWSLPLIPRRPTGRRVTQSMTDVHYYICRPMCPA